jgi:hypothetical protein
VHPRDPFHAGKRLLIDQAIHLEVLQTTDERFDASDRTGGEQSVCLPRKFGDEQNDEALGKLDRRPVP